MILPLRVINGRDNNKVLGRPYGLVAFTALRCDPAACAITEFA